MTRHFNTGGVCLPSIHYMLPPERRLPEVRGLVDQMGYFILHAPRQVGKTTALTAMARSLTAEGRYAAVLVSMEVGAPHGDDIGAAEDAILNSDQTLLAVLRQLRDGHRLRPTGFPWSLALVGLRDVRDYKVASGGSDLLHTASPFDIKVESLTMRSFTKPEVAELYAQHTAETGQLFDPAALTRAFEVTRGQPWIVNALARQLVQVIVPDRAITVTAADVDRARDLLIERQDTHLDSLAERLRDPRVRAVIEPMILGDQLASASPDDLRFVLDLGLVVQSSDGAIEIANPIYREIVMRSLTTYVRASLPRLAPSWLRESGAIDWTRLREVFVEFWLQHGEALLGSSPHNKAAARLVLMAFLHRIVNGGGRVDRELAIGSKRLDLCVEYKGDRLGIEV